MNELYFSSNDQRTEKNQDSNTEELRLKEELEIMKQYLAKEKQKSEALATENNQMHSENHQLKEELKGTKEEIRELSIDSVMDIPVRILFYKKLHKLVSHAIDEHCGKSSTEWEEMSTDNFTTYIQNLDINTFLPVNLSVFMGDVAYLSLVNKGGHAIGDELLQKIGTSAKNFEKDSSGDIEFFKHGGDEIAGILHTNETKGQILSEEFKKRTEQMEMEYLATIGIDKNIGLDVGSAHFSEGFRAFRDFLIATKAENQQRENPYDRIDLHQKERLRTLLEIWIGLADKRSLLAKAFVRIKKLKDYRDNAPSIYEEVIGSLRKGALDITDLELDQLENTDHNIREFILRKEQENYERQANTDQKKKSIIHGILNRMVTQEFTQSNSNKQTFDSPNDHISNT